MPAKSTSPDPSHWEQRSADRVIDGTRDRLLARSRQLVDKAREVVARDGVDGLTVRTILNETGLSRRAFYERFAGKDDLLVAVFEETMRQAADSLREEFRARRIEDPLLRLRCVVVRMIEGAGLGGGLSAAMSREHLRLAESRPDELRQVVGPTTDLMAEEIAAAMDAGTVRPGDPAELAALVHGLVASTIHTRLLGTTAAYDGKRTAEVVWEFCRRALAA